MSSTGLLTSQGLSRFGQMHSRATTVVCPCWWTLPLDTPHQGRNGPTLTPPSGAAIG